MQKISYLQPMQYFDFIVLLMTSVITLILEKMQFSLKQGRRYNKGVKAFEFAITSKSHLKTLFIFFTRPLS
jgi:hypothetical protein